MDLRLESCDALVNTICLSASISDKFRAHLDKHDTGYIDRVHFTRILTRVLQFKANAGVAFNEDNIGCLLEEAGCAHGEQVHYPTAIDALLGIRPLSPKVDQ
mmetsp:Transcript_115605/g.181882  ORF Transcript_115605/g.181882 Transcript_115605/m.181882 type:complete len:102 (+) Transcript_115605:37-342(+)